MMKPKNFRRWLRIQPHPSSIIHHPSNYGGKRMTWGFVIDYHEMGLEGMLILMPMSRKPWCPHTWGKVITLTWCNHNTFSCRDECWVYSDEKLLVWLYQNIWCLTLYEVIACNSIHDGICFVSVTTIPALEFQKMSSCMLEYNLTNDGCWFCSDFSQYKQQKSDHGWIGPVHYQ